MRSSLPLASVASYKAQYAGPCIIHQEIYTGWKSSDTKRYQEFCMYSPSHYQYSDEKLIREVIEQNPFATLISSDLTISHLPLYYFGNKLIGHMARANSQWQVANGSIVKAIFHGPHAYVSPSWYVENPQNVPTWNYVTVHVKGKFQIVKDDEEGFRSMQRQIEKNEGPHGWTMPQDRTNLEQLFRAITVFEVTDLEFEAKFKLSQKHDEENKRRVIAMLEQKSEEARKVAGYMKRLSLRP
jgi:transcriptional regulator